MFVEKAQSKRTTEASELLTWAAAGCLARSVFVGVTQRVAQLVGGSRVNLMSGK